MITTEILLAFIAASALVTVAPGPDNLMVLSVGISRGREAGIGFGLGCALGCFVHTLWAALGIGAVVMASEGTFTVLKMAGAAYLVYIGVMAWRHAGASTLVKLDDGRAEPVTARISSRPGSGRWLARGRPIPSSQASPAVERLSPRLFR